MQDPPDSVDALELEFKLKHKLRMFNNDDASLFYKPINSLVSASKYGLIFVCTPGCKINVIPLNAVLQLNIGEECRRFPVRIIDLPGSASHLNINCDSTLLSVSIRMAGYIGTLIYNVTSFLTADVTLFQNVDIACSDDVFVLDSEWNPTIPTIYSICKSDGSIDIFDFKKNGSIAKTQLPAESNSCCFCWSPKGKQIAVGAKSGTITQYKPDLMAVKVIAAPPSMGPVISLQWVSNYQFIATYTSPTLENVLIVIDASKTGSIVYTNYHDICYSQGTMRSNHFYFQMLLEWNTIIVASANSSEVSVLGIMNDRWTQFILADSARAELPLSSHTKQDTLPIGLVVDFTFKKSSLPYLLLLSSEGLLFCYAILNAKGNAKSLCYPQEPPPYSDLLFQFFEVGEPSQQQNILNMVPLADEQVLIKDNVSYNTTSDTTTLSYVMQPVISRDPLLRTDFEITRTSKASNEEMYYSPFSVKGKSKCHRRKYPSKISILIHEECCHLESELNALLYKGRSTPLITECDSIKVLENSIKMIVSEVMESLKLQEAEVRILKQSMIQSWAWYEDVKSRFTTYSNPTMTTLTRFQPLNLTYERQLGDMQYLIYYLESQLVHGNRSLDEQWEIFQMSCKETSTLQLPSTEMIYRTMVTHNATLQKQMYVMKDVSTRLQFHLLKLTVPSACVSTKLVESLFQKIKVDSENFERVKRERVKKRFHLLALRKLSVLKSIMKYHNTMNLQIANKNNKDSSTSYSSTSLETPGSFDNHRTIISIDNVTVVVPIKEKSFTSVSANRDRYINLKRSHLLGLNNTNSRFTSTPTFPQHNTLDGALQSTNPIFDIYKREIGQDGAESITSKTTLDGTKNSSVDSAINMALVPLEARSLLGTKYLMQYPSSTNERHLPKATTIFDFTKLTDTHATTTLTVSSSGLKSYSSTLLTPSCLTSDKFNSKGNALFSLSPIITSSTSKKMDTTLCYDSNTRTIPNTISLATFETITTTLYAEPLITTKISNMPAFMIESKTVTNKNGGILENEKQFVTNTTATSNDTSFLLNDSSRQSSSPCNSYAVAISTKSNTHTNTSIFGTISSTRENEVYKNEGYTDNTVSSNNAIQCNLTMDSSSISDLKKTDLEIVSPKMSTSTIFRHPNHNNSLSNNPFGKSITNQPITEAVNIFDKESTIAWSLGEDVSKSSTCYNVANQFELLESNLFTKSNIPFESNNMNTTKSSKNEAGFGSYHTNLSGLIPLGTSIVQNSETFGTVPLFGVIPGSGVSTFGSSDKVFGDSESDMSLVSGSTFANLANQNSIGFENQVSNSSANAFTGGSSFTSWR